MKHSEAIKRAAPLVGNRRDRGEKTADEYLRKRYPHMHVMRYCSLLRDAYYEARRRGIVNHHGKRPNER